MTTTPELYWETYYAEEFRYGQGTEVILRALCDHLPAVASRLDVGSGSEALFWATALSARRLVALDLSRERLELLKRCAKLPAPRGAYKTALGIAGRDETEWEAICHSLIGCVIANALAPTGLPCQPESFDLVSQFGLLGLTPDPASFMHAFNSIAAAARRNGWLVGANWRTTAAERVSRVELTNELYYDACHAAGATPVLVGSAPITGDPLFDRVWFYIARKGASR